MLLLNLILSTFLWFSFPDPGKETVDSIDPVVSAIDSGSSSDLARYFNTSISLNVNGQQGEYSKNQAEIVLKDFFKKNPPLGFSLVFRSEKPTSLSTYIGEYASGQGTFKVFIKVSQNDNSFRIYSLDFVKN
ncbi:DUF4783 domain-containing protein [Algoriphagus lacus]|uniref:DUF4783 domain-containing protein n=1 Tax=Algoriphagus lacus TaxID=2056311 RepID=A0A418PVL8_9BACT|nr:DUF4783 domain-containing protein [Algoriphagus lacus]RIW18227.1 DUF4783 domain-containing protein [Algoriphagus lacus]